MTNFSNIDSFASLHEDIKLYCTFEFDDTVTALSAKPKWSSQDGLARNVIPSLYTSDTLLNVTVILSFYNVTKNDGDIYTLSVRYLESCTKQCDHSISLTVMPECFGRVPEPINDSNVTISSSVDVPYLNLTAEFTGDDTSHNIIWSRDDGDVLRETDKYTISYRRTQPCTITKDLIIYYLSMTDAGVYSVRPQRSNNVKYFKVILFESKPNPNHKKESVLLAIIVSVAAFISVCICLCIGVLCIRFRKKKRACESNEILCT